MIERLASYPCQGGGRAFRSNNGVSSRMWVLTLDGNLVDLSKFRVLTVKNTEIIGVPAPGSGNQITLCTFESPATARAALEALTVAISNGKTLHRFS